MLSHAETGQIVLQRQPVDMTLLLNDIADQFQIPAEEAKVTLTLNLEKDLVIQADRVQMGRLFSNLLSNAVKYTPGGGTIDVVLKLSTDKSLTYLTVKDTGEGIDETHLPHIFERFYKVPNANPEKGLGLGLSFVAWIVKAHGGTIQVKSRLGEGTAFEVALPTNGLTQLPKDTASRRKFVK